jgi:predicted DCC family thiol-disulfide oxidoreductase YuxK
LRRNAPFRGNQNLPACSVATLRRWQELPHKARILIGWARHGVNPVTDSKYTIARYDVFSDEWASCPLPV